MAYSTKSLPFQIKDVDYGLRKVEGLMKLEKNNLVFEFQTKDALVGLVKSDVEEQRIAISELEGAELKGWLTYKLILRGRSLRVFENLPGTEQGQCKLHIKRSDRETARNLVSRINLLLSEDRIRRLDEME